MKKILHSMSIILLSIIYTVGSGVFSHTMAMGNMMHDDMQDTMECCNEHDMDVSEHKSISTHCLGYEDGKITNIEYTTTYTPSCLIDHIIPFVGSSLGIRQVVDDTILSENNFYDQKFLGFKDLV